MLHLDGVDVDCSLYWVGRRYWKVLTPASDSVLAALA